MFTSNKVKVALGRELSSNAVLELLSLADPGDTVKVQFVPTLNGDEGAYIFEFETPQTFDIDCFYPGVFDCIENLG